MPTSIRGFLTMIVAAVLGSVVTLAITSGRDPVAAVATAQTDAPQTDAAGNDRSATTAPATTAFGNGSFGNATFENGTAILAVQPVAPGLPSTRQPADTLPTLPPADAPNVPPLRSADEIGSGIDLTPAPLTTAEKIAAGVYEQCNRSVVNIAITSIRPGGVFAPPRAETGDSGSGIVLDKLGHILTNNHVIESARQVTVTLHSGRSYRGRLVGTDPLNDIAVLKIDAEADLLEPVRLVDSDSVVVGQRVFAIGNPFGLKRTLSTGIVASMDRTLEVQDDWVIKEVIQIDASINPGSSGGPLLDAKGRLIGMNTAIAAETRQSAGIGFAIPTRLIVRTVPELIEHGRVVRGTIGIDQLAEAKQGLRIHRLVPGGAAEQAGIRGPKIRVHQEGPYIIREIDPQAADILVALDGQPIDSAADFNVYLDRKKPGEIVEVTVLREGELLKVNVTLGGESPKRRQPPRGGRTTL